MGDDLPDPHISKSHSARVNRLEGGGWHLEIPAHNRYGYHLAQLDDHGTLRRSNFRWQPTLSFSLQARVSAENLAGTWGFGLWNDPFSFLLSYHQAAPRLPALPNAVWFFYASPESYLSLGENLPANGLLAATFSSSNLPIALLALFAPTLIFSLVPGAAQGVRRLFRYWVRQDAEQLQARQVEWHRYRIEWETEQVRFYLDEVELLRTSIVPRPPLSLVIWIDNQYAAFPPRGRLKYGYLPHSEPAWLEIKDFWLGACA
jgi:hypothetical protein